MKRKIIYACLFALLLAALGFTAPRWSSPSWEYKIVTNSEYDGDKTEADALSLTGSQGWELVSVEPSAHGHRYFFKRQK
jgi:hypothetical protein